MSSLLESYRRNAEAARVEAELATLPNLRRRAEIDAEAWTTMVNRLERLEAMQQGREQF
jgi:hypothetical protein